LISISNDYSIRKLGSGKWKNIQRLNYLLFGLVLIHTLLYAFVENRPFGMFAFSLLALGATVVIQAAGIYKYRQLRLK
jgi:DMSO/TMAO reductase YedYZ heme-binding membrane subunit